MTTMMMRLLNMGIVRAPIKFGFATKFKWTKRHPAWYLMFFLLTMQQLSLYLLSSMQVEMTQRRTSAEGPLGLRRVYKQKTISACMGPLHTVNEESINIPSILAWLHYHEKRWGLTHVDIHIQQDNFVALREKLNAALLEAYQSKFLGKIVADFHVTPNWKDAQGRQSLHTMVVNQCHAAAQARSSDYYIGFDPNEFLVSDDFQTLDEMFEHYDTPGIVFPIFQAHYNVCERHKPTFDSVTYRSALPHGSHVNTKEPSKLYSNPPRGVKGMRKYIVRPDQFRDLANVHDPIHDWDRTQAHGLLTYLHGRGRSSKIIQLHGHVGLHADERGYLCTTVPKDACRYYDWTTQKCVDKVKQGTMELDRTEINSILAGVPLNDHVMPVYRQATCYVKNDKTLQSKYCVKGDLDNCNAEKLLKNVDLGNSLFFNDCMTN